MGHDHAFNPPRPPAPAISSASGMAAVHLTHPARCALELVHLPLITCRITGRRCAPPPHIHFLCNQRGATSSIDLWVGIPINSAYVTDKQAPFSITFPGSTFKKMSDFFRSLGSGKIFLPSNFGGNALWFFKIPGN